MLGDIGSKWADRLHQQVAKNLRVKGWSQSEIADILGSTQSTISRQISKTVTELGPSADEAMVDAWANELAQALNSIGPGGNVIRQRIIWEVQFAGQSTPLVFDKSFTGLDLNAGEEQRALLRRLEWAAGRLDIRRISDNMPAVGMNIAACLASAETSDDVAAYPGRITIVDGKLRHHETPSFGASKHLANLLISILECDPSKVACLNLLPPLKDEGVDVDKIKAVCDELGYKLASASKGELIGKPEKVDIILDSGAFGWEPSLYVCAHNPLELIDRTHQILFELKK